MLSSKKKHLIIFSGFNQRAVIAFLRTLHHHHIDYSIIAKSEEDTVFLTDYRDKVVAVRNQVSLNIEDIVTQIQEVQKFAVADEYIIAPTTEALNRFLLDHRNQLLRMGCYLPLVDKELYELISDKYSFSKLCADYAINIPREIAIDKNVQYPIVAKPKKYFSKKGIVYTPVIIQDEEQFERFLKEHENNDFYFQEYIEGRSLYLMYYFSKNGECRKFSQENVLQQPDGKSILAAVSSDFHHSGESGKYEKLFKSLHYFGLVMVEVRQRNGINYMIEANPRFWGPSQLFVDAGVNLFEDFLYDHGFIDCVKKRKEPENTIYYFWMGGLVEVWKQNKKVKQYQDDWFVHLHKFINSDVYRRKDTQFIFKKELNL